MNHPRSEVNSTSIRASSNVFLEQLVVQGPPVVHLRFVVN